MTEKTPRRVLDALLSEANRQLVDSNKRAKALSGVIDRCTDHMRTALGYPTDARDAGLESLVVQAKHHFPLFRRSLERQHVLDVLVGHRPYEYDWSCTCGDMPSADHRTHRAKHHEHLADLLTATTIPPSTGPLDSETRPATPVEEYPQAAQGCCPGGPFQGHRAWCGVLQAQIRPILDEADRKQAEKSHEH